MPDPVEAGEAAVAMFLGAHPDATNVEVTEVVDHGETCEVTLQADVRMQFKMEVGQGPRGEG